MNPENGIHRARAAAARRELTGLEIVVREPLPRTLARDPRVPSTGKKRELGEVIGLDDDNSDAARDGRPRDASPEMADISLVEGDREPLAAFRRSRNEDDN